MASLKELRARSMQSPQVIPNEQFKKNRGNGGLYQDMKQTITEIRGIYSECLTQINNLVDKTKTELISILAYINNNINSQPEFFEKFNLLKTKFNQKDGILNNFRTAYEGLIKSSSDKLNIIKTKIGNYNITGKPKEYAVLLGSINDEYEKIFLQISKFTDAFNTYEMQVLTDFLGKYDIILRQLYNNFCDKYELDKTEMSDMLNTLAENSTDNIIISIFSNLNPRISKFNNNLKSIYRINNVKNVSNDLKRQINSNNIKQKYSTELGKIINRKMIKRNYLIKKKENLNVTIGNEKKSLFEGGGKIQNIKEMQQRIEALNKTISNIDVEIQSITNQIKLISTEISELERKLADRIGQMGIAQNNLNKLTGELSSLRNELDSLKAELDGLNNERDQVMTQIKKYKTLIEKLEALRFNNGRAYQGNEESLNSLSEEFVEIPEIPLDAFLADSGNTSSNVASSFGKASVASSSENTSRAFASASEKASAVFASASGNAQNIQPNDIVIFNGADGKRKYTVVPLNKSMVNPGISSTKWGIYITGNAKYKLLKDNNNKVKYYLIESNKLRKVNTSLNSADPRSIESSVPSAVSDVEVLNIGGTSTNLVNNNALELNSAMPGVMQNANTIVAPSNIGKKSAKSANNNNVSGLRNFTESSVPSGEPSNIGGEINTTSASPQNEYGYGQQVKYKPYGSQTYNKTGTILTYKQYKQKFPKSRLLNIKSEFNNSSVSYINTNGKKKYFSVTQNGNPKFLNSNNIEPRKSSS
jgi:GR25 family glycosyltransferase involved in LPS biosynthesis